ncbi:hypothetical protein PPL_00094 [Heterostelium album PN500]|uniref:Integrase catalytic domain-containing protein n=1 Tax=Heterostelium pallidum (strain ATCC 26659 / Pp 5 / PN500) TaxID=670386 RepID=D3AVI2_HETP5|nr:hypothetical protein PPL_00094 [Heterostelium album PN500]EFA86305.1 hypothetical protein PPL_00094 [Heterostelium album PN500]|eukprot:XP_020438410.1 hypothetical protein PPL_00094 [Heterostelium album PN500]
MILFLGFISCIVIRYKFKINDATVELEYKIPVVDEVFNSLRGCKYFSIGDVVKGYFHVKMDLESRKYTAFRTRKVKDYFDDLISGDVTLEENVVRVIRISKKTEILDRMEYPTTPKQVQRTLGFFNYYRKFVDKFVEKTKHAEELRVFKTDFEINDEAKIRFIAKRVEKYSRSNVARSNKGVLCLYRCKRHRKDVELVKLRHKESWRESKGLIFILDKSFNKRLLLVDEKHIKEVITEAHGMVDRFSKYTTIIPTTKEITALGTAKLIHQHVFSLIGLPLSIVSDRDTRFTSEVWLELFKKVGSKLRMSVPRHSQSDGQSERTNRRIRSMLRKLSLEFKDKWDEEIKNIQFATNSTYNSTFKLSPFEVVLGYIPVYPINMFRNNNTSNREWIREMVKDITNILEYRSLKMINLNFFS